MKKLMRGVFYRPSRTKIIIPMLSNKLKSFKLDEYFLYPQIGWEAKSSMVKQIQIKLNIGMDSILFIE